MHRFQNPLLDSSTLGSVYVVRLGMVRRTKEREMRATHTEREGSEGERKRERERERMTGWSC